MKRTGTIAALLVLLLAGCAKQGFPTGGPKDTQPPKPTATQPPNESRGFSARSFYIGFDEYVVLKNPESNVLVSPPMAQKPEFTTRGMGVKVTLKDTLQPNTTYLFQFREAIADFTEGNVLDGYEYVFSTGQTMDTMMLAGSVVKARDGKAWGEALAVSAIREGDTVPAFVTRSDKEGHFAFHYITPGRYRLVAMDDVNKNWLPDSTEAAAWDTTIYAADTAIDSTLMPQLLISVPNRQKQRILKAQFTARGRIEISTLLPMQHPVLEGEAHRCRLRSKGDTLDVWLQREQADSTRLVFHDGTTTDTLKLRYRPPAKKSRTGFAATPTKPPLVQALCDGDKAFYDSLMLAFTTPIASIQDSATATVTRMKDSSQTQVPILIDSTGLSGRIATTLVSGEEYTIRLAEGLFTDYYGHRSDSLVFRMKPRDYGVLSLQIDNQTGGPLVIEVLDAKDTVVGHAPLAASGKVQFRHMTAGTYRMRAVLDADSNGRWTTGDYLTGRQPEKFLMFDKSLQLREKWEIEEQWTVDPRPATTEQTVPRSPRNSTPRNMKGTIELPSFGKDKE